MTIKIPKRKIEIPERFQSCGSLRRMDLSGTANRLRDMHNLIYQLFIGGFDNNSASKNLSGCLRNVENWMLDDPLDAGYLGIRFYDASKDDGFNGLWDRHMGSRTITYSDRTLEGWNEEGHNPLPEGCEFLADELGRHYLATIDNAIEGFQRFQEGVCRNGQGFIENLQDPSKK